MNNPKKIKLDTVETFLNINLIPDITVLGVDVSQYSTGLALIRTTDSYLVIEKTHVIKVPHNPDDFLKSVDVFLDQLEDFKRQLISKHNINKVVIEDCFFGKNILTLKALARFGILVYDRFKGITNECVFILPTSARKAINFNKIDKKSKGHALKKEIISYVNSALGMKFKMMENDIADAIVLALAGAIIK